MAPDDGSPEVAPVSLMGPELEEHLAALHADGSLDSHGEFSLSLDRALEFFSRALLLKPILPCTKAVQAAIASGAEAVQVAHHRHRLLVASRGGGAELSRALLGLDRNPTLTSNLGLSSYLSWALWAAVADGASQVNCYIGDQGPVWQFALRRSQDETYTFSSPTTPFEGPLESRVIWEVLYPQCWFWQQFHSQMMKNWAYRFELTRNFAFSVVPVSVGGRVLNNPDVWRIIEPRTAWGLLSPNVYGVSERAFGAYTWPAGPLGPRMALFPPFPQDPFPSVKSRPGKAFSSNMPEVVCFSHHAAFCYPFYYMEDDSPGSVVFHSEMPVGDLLEQRITPALLGLTAPPAQVGSGRKWRRLPLMGAKYHALYCPDSRDPGSLFVVQDGLLHEPLETGLRGLTLFLAGQGIPTDANGMRPVLGPHFSPDLEVLIARLKPWASTYRSVSSEDDVQLAMRHFTDGLQGLRELGG